MNLDMTGKVAIVTGGARGVGKGCAAAFVKAGAGVLIVDREADLGQATRAELLASGRVEFLATDLADHDRLPGVIDAAIEHFGRIDTLVNAAQASQQALLAETDVTAMKLPFDTGFWPTFILMKSAYPHLVASK